MSHHALRAAKGLHRRRFGNVLTVGGARQDVSVGVEAAFFVRFFQDIHLLLKQQRQGHRRFVFPDERFAKRERRRDARRKSLRFTGAQSTRLRDAVRVRRAARRAGRVGHRVRFRYGVTAAFRPAFTQGVGLRFRHGVTDAGGLKRSRGIRR